MNPTPHPGGAGGPAGPRTRRPTSGPATRGRRGEVGRTGGVPIAAKYAGVTAVLLVIFLILVARSDLRSSLRKVDQLIHESGVAAAMLFAAEVDPYWARPDGDGGSSGAQGALAARLSARVADPALADRVLDVVVLGVDGRSFEANARGGRSLAVRMGGSLRSERAEAAGVTVRAGSLDGRAVRMYAKPVLWEGRTVGSVQVYLSAESIRQVEDQFRSAVIRTVLIALLIGIPVVLVVGRYLTRPIRLLKRDMEVVAQGNLEHQSVVRTRDELGSLATAFNRMTHQLAEAQEAEFRRLSLERDLSIATRIQTSLLPEALPEIEGYDLAARYDSAKEVGGDLYDFIPLPGGRFGIVVADVSGKGIPGSLVMTMTRSLLRMAAHDHAEVSELLARVNENLSRDMSQGMFVTLVYLDFDPGTGRVRVGRAGHNPLYLYQASRGSVGQIQPQGIALGMDPGPLFEKALQVGEFQLEPGDFLVLYTDGVVEAMDPGGVEYSPERFVATLEGAREQDAASIVAAVNADLAAHVGAAEQSDDITLLVIRRD